MTTFLLTLDLTDHEHPHSSMAMRMFVAGMLDQVKQQIGSGMSREGKVTANVGPLGRVDVGFWKLDSPEELKKAVGE